MFKKSKYQRNILNQLSPVQLLLLFYGIAVVFSTILLSLPIAHKPDVSIPFIDIMFTAVSAISVTGLSTITIVDSFSTTGIIFLAIIMQLGAVGIMAIGTLIWLVLGKRIGFKERSMIMTDQNQTHFDGMVRLIKGIIYVLLIIELIGFLILGTYFLQYFPTAKEAYLQGFFGTISAISNGGFDITGQSLILFKDDYFVQFINILLIIFGAIGFPVLIELKEYLFRKRTEKNLFHFSLFTKVTTFTFFVLIVIGALGIYLLDMNAFFKDLTWHESLFYAFFQSVTTRSGGLATMDVSLLTETNQLFMSGLMFIGASPSSAGGGIRTTTFALAIIFVFTYIRGGNSVRIFNREVYNEDLIKAVSITLFAITLVIFSTLILTAIEPFSLEEIIFEVTSAFGTVGLSLGITSELSNISKVLIMLLMFIGRIGIVTFLLIFKRKKKKAKYHFPKERIIIG
ncbi:MULTISPECIES: TrkH family potassium uptake protein [Oceanobacillus]|uniref:Ktr system potassium uptake protein D n=1 Tax=Oceanobacillus kimchii TaxID=746691 RepID=A0ABQ5TL36_9BACI|nr:MULTISPECIES: TrkH family potassium uptake protein [Oceanobacillus]MBT2598875.1 TrkH family potassium uptake protein [Oceanobacillus sp. ISL-74]MBT2651794.1 TrkH family potassium uptake protein [Oceanobacillus sp. ISL-73]MCT1576443.1 TrkH family potassium uptake protein [Oceanobacillus kimchii]MCT2136079.1 TrkH family potassium uptake protein [Oceanobacillus kimchii]GLO65830.1 ktr system potassium uptake protein D [Oceanobacillus kimchii]